MTAAQRTVGALVALLSTAALAVGSRAPITAARDDNAMLRLAWSARPERVERCERVSDSALAALPEHMRQQVICEGTSARYRLEVRRNGATIATAELRGGGLRHDRQLYVFREIALAPGRAELEVRLARVDTVTPSRALDTHRESGDEFEWGTDRAAHESAERARRVADALPPFLAWRDTVTLASHEVVILTFDRGTRRFRAVRSAP